MHLQAAQLNTVSVTAKGFGISESEAISDAVINAVAQVNGETVASTMRVQKQTTSSTNEATNASRSIEKDISRKTQGVVKSWRKISVTPSAGGYSATVAANLVVLKRSEQLKRRRLAVTASGGDSYTLKLVESVTENLTSSRKFAILDRRQGDLIQSQLEKIKRGGSIEDKVRLSGEVAPDFIAVTTLVMTSSDERQKAEATLEVIDYTSRQVKFFEKKSLTIASRDPIVINKRLQVLGKMLSRAVIETVYPPMIVGVSDDGLITIAQGSDFFSVGDKCVIKEFSGNIKDPYTKEFLGHNLKEIGVAEVVSTNKRLSQATLKPGLVLTPEMIAEKRYLVTRKTESAEDVLKLIDNISVEPSSTADANDSGFKDDDY
jgi:hypothetical protein